MQSYANDNYAIIDSANKAYTNGNYLNAIESYEQVLGNGVEAPELYYNLGNSYFKTNNIPAAILNYERARRLSPKDEDLQFNLKLANLKTVDKIVMIPPLFFKVWWNDLTNIYSGDTWAIVSIVSLWLCILIFCLFIISRQPGFKRLFFWICILLFIFTFLSFNFAYKRYNEIHNSDEAIIFSASIVVKSSPDENGTDLFVLHEGTKVLIKDRVGDWNKIVLLDGKEGWLSADVMEVI